MNLEFVAGGVAGTCLLEMEQQAAIGRAFGLARCRFAHRKPWVWRN
jgi:hypothetical protein